MTKKNKNKNKIYNWLKNKIDLRKEEEEKYVIFIFRVQKVCFGFHATTLVKYLLSLNFC
jgi:hypothetical protein